jgi:hypothetical protein
MPSFVKGGGVTTPFGRNEYLRSTRGKKVESYTCAGATVPARTIDGNPGQKVLQPGTAMAKITTGPDAGKVGPFQAGATDGRADVANLVGLDDTFLPWQLIERDVEIGVTYTCVAVQGWCKELNAAGVEIPLADATANAMRGTKGLDILFH